MPVSTKAFLSRNLPPKSYFGCPHPILSGQTVNAPTCCLENASFFRLCVLVAIQVRCWGMSSNSVQSIGDFFGKKWPLYQKAIRRNVLCHEEMFGALDDFLNERFTNHPFAFADLGCGDASAAFGVLQNKAIDHYIGVDAAPDLIAKATSILGSLNCQKTLLCSDMATAVRDLPVSVDVILCSYSMHHLLAEEKETFIHSCYQRLKAPGYLIMIDGIAMENESREQWLHRLEQRFLTNVPESTTDELDQIMKHPREADYPGTIAEFRSISERSPWQRFDVLIHRDDFLAFVLFEK